MINSLLMYAAYLLGALIFILDKIKEYEKISIASPGVESTYRKMTFWNQERWNILQMILLGIVSVVMLPMLFGGSSFALHKESGEVLWQVPMKTALIPLQIVVGWTGGRAIIKFMGRSKEELYKTLDEVVQIRSGWNVKDIASNVNGLFPIFFAPEGFLAQWMLQEMHSGGFGGFNTKFTVFRGLIMF